MNYFIDERRHYGPAAAKLRSGKYLTPNPMLIAHLQGSDMRVHMLSVGKFSQRKSVVKHPPTG